MTAHEFEHSLKHGRMTAFPKLGKRALMTSSFAPIGCSKAGHSCVACRAQGGHHYTRLMLVCQQYDVVECSSDHGDLVETSVSQASSFCFRCSLEEGSHRVRARFRKHIIKLKWCTYFLPEVGRHGHRVLSGNCNTNPAKMLGLSFMFSKLSKFGISCTIHNES